MHKPTLIAAAVVLLISMGSFAFAGSAVDGVEEDFENIETDKYLSTEATSHSIVFEDEDGEGSAGFLILIPGNYTDANGDYLNDECVAFEFTVKDQGDEDVTDDTSEKLCKASSVDYEYINADDGWMVVASVCDTFADTELEEVETCSLGRTYTVESTTSMMMFDADSYFIELITTGLDFLGDVVGASCMGILGICCGLVLLITGLLVGGNKQMPVAMQTSVGHFHNTPQAQSQNMAQQYIPPVNQVAQQTPPSEAQENQGSQIWDQTGHQ